MVFSNFSTTSYLPLDNDQSVTFYKNENRLFPTAIVASPGAPASLRGLMAAGAARASTSGGGGHSGSGTANMSTTDMLTAAYHEQQQQHHHHAIEGGGNNGGDCPFGRVQSPAGATTAAAAAAAGAAASAQQHHHHHRVTGGVAMCDDFQPIAYLNGSSNGYYGYVPTLATTPRGATGASDICGPMARYYQQQQPVDDLGSGNNNNNNNNNNINNNNEEIGYHFNGHQQSQAALQQHNRKRKEISTIGGDDEAMDTNGTHACDQPLPVGSEFHPKRRKMEAEDGTLANGMLFAGNVTQGDAYSNHHHHHLQQHERHLQSGTEMEYQEHQHHRPASQYPHYTFPGTVHPQHQQFHSPSSLTMTTDQHQQQMAGPHGGGDTTSKSKYFDSSRCMMSHMI